MREILSRTVFETCLADQSEAPWEEEVRMLLAHDAALRAEVERLRADLEQTWVQLAGCGVIAMCNTENSLREQMPAPGSYGYSASLADVKRAVRREIVLRAAAQEALAVLTRLADSAAYWSSYDVPVGIVAEIDAAKARLAGVLNG